MKNIAIIAGGNSSEFGISIQSGKNIYDQVDGTRYNKYLLILKGRDWHVEIGEEKFPVDKNDFSFVRNGERIVFDFAYITIHGNPGENGLLQGYLDMMGVPYSGSNVLASALTFNKYKCNTYLKGQGMNVANSVMLTREQVHDVNEIVKEVGLPCFVKPNAEGSSYGVTKVKEIAHLESALQYAFTFCDEVLIETFISGTELTCGVLNLGHMSYALPIAEVIPKKEFFDFEAKYDPKMSDEIIPARISRELRNRIEVLSLMVCTILGCDGLVRVDYIVRDGEIFMLEVNTTPGMTSNSFVPKMIRAMGETLRKVLSEIIEQKLRK